MKYNEILKETLLLNGFDYVDNNNILFCNLGKDGLLINEGGGCKCKQREEIYQILLGL